MDATSSIRDYVELQVDFLLSLHPSVFIKNDRKRAGMTGQMYMKRWERAEVIKMNDCQIACIAGVVAVPVERGKLSWRGWW